jgi:hypothetical protein
MRVPGRPADRVGKEPLITAKGVSPGPDCPDVETAAQTGGLLHQGTHQEWSLMNARLSRKARGASASLQGGVQILNGVGIRHHVLALSAYLQV